MRAGGWQSITNKFELYLARFVVVIDGRQYAATPLKPKNQLNLCESRDCKQTQFKV